MTDKLTKGPEGGLARRFDPQIQTTANPRADDLREARRMLNAGPIREFIEQTQAQGHDPESLVDGVAVRLDEAWGGGQAQAAFECAQYLFDEFRQLGEGLFVVSTETGRVVATVTEEDFYQPAPVPREDGGMVLPQKRLKPEIEAALYCWVFDRGREQNIISALAARANQTAFLAENGDPRLLVATREGRRHIVREFAKLDPGLLLRSAGGTGGIFLRHFDLVDHEPEPKSGFVKLEGSAFSKTTMGVQDPLTTNLHHNRPASLQGALVQGWLREVAKKLSLAAPNGREVSQRALTKEHLDGISFWIAPPEAVRYLRKANPVIQVMPVEGAGVLGLRDGILGILKVNPEFAASHREWFDRWEAETRLSYGVWVNWGATLSLNLKDIEHEAVLVK